MADSDVRQIEDYAGEVEAVVSRVVPGSLCVRSYEDLAKITGDEGLLSARRASEAAEKMARVRGEGLSPLRKTYLECIARPVFEDGWAKVRDQVEQIDYQTAETLNAKRQEILWHSNGGSPECWIEYSKDTCGPNVKLQEMIRSLANGLRHVAGKAKKNGPGQGGGTRGMGRTSKRFSVALSFPGERRVFVEQVAARLADHVGRERVLYDKYHEAEFARPELDVYLPQLYAAESELIVIFLCEDYAKKQWCKLEWRHIRQLIATSESSRIMFVSFDDIGAIAEIGILPGDGYVVIGSRSPEEIASVILKRLELGQRNGV